MARPLRIEFKDAVYYISSKGNAGNSITQDDADRKLFLETVHFVVDRYKWKCHAYSILKSQYCLVIETPKPNLSIGMRQLNGIYTQKYNRKHDLAGHVFQGRFKAVLVERENYLLDICRHVVLLPSISGTTKNYATYKWSSYKATAGLAGAPEFLETEWILSQFAKTRKIAQKKYIEYVKNGKKAQSPLNNVRGQILLGSDSFIQKLKPQITKGKYESDIPKWQKNLNRPAIEDVFKGIKNKTLKQRNIRIKQANAKHGYTLKQIGDYLGLHYTSISRIINSI
jgi:putative transposase